jgi:hypothetical protein
MFRTTLSLLAFTLAMGCGSSEPPPKTLEELAAEKCPRVHLDGAKMAGDWLVATGNPKTRFRIRESGGTTTMWYIDPMFSNHKLELIGTKRDKDWRFEENPVGERVRLVGEGGEDRKRVYLRPRQKTCAMELYVGTVDADGVEAMPPKGKEFLQWPDGQAVTFSYAPHAEALFIGGAAKMKGKADAEIAENGRPDIEAEMGAVSVGMWSDAAADGAEGCSFTLDAYFDDQPVEGGQGQAAGTVGDGMRHWAHTFDAPYSGNHGFELHRYRQCEGGARELIAVAGIDAALF